MFAECPSSWTLLIFCLLRLDGCDDDAASDRSLENRLEWIGLGDYNIKFVIFKHVLVIDVLAFPV